MRSFGVVHVARTEAVVEFPQVTVKALGVNVNVRALESTLQLRKSSSRLVVSQLRSNLRTHYPAADRPKWLKP